MLQRVFSPSPHSKTPPVPTTPRPGVRTLGDSSRICVVGAVLHLGTQHRQDVRDLLSRNDNLFRRAFAGVGIVGWSRLLGSNLGPFLIQPVLSRPKTSGKERRHKHHTEEYSHFRTLP